MNPETKPYVDASQMSGKETDERLYERTSRDLKRGKLPGDFNVKLRMCNPKPGEKILDIGCGIGWFAATVASQYGTEVLAIDTSEYAINDARRRYGSVDNLDFQVCDALLIEYEEAFDKISCLDVLEHFAYEDGQILLKKIHAALRQGGSLVLCVPLNDVWHSRPVRKVAEFLNIPTFEHKTFFSMQKIEAELMQAGFSVVELSPWFWLEDQLRIMLPQRIYSLPLIGKYLVGSVNIRAVKNSYAPSCLPRYEGEICNPADTLV
jgi:cyclopropane fatty-acyl-phospholipid synthase-like methyltransferase